MRGVRDTAGAGARAHPLPEAPRSSYRGEPPGGLRAPGRRGPGGSWLASPGTCRILATRGTRDGDGPRRRCGPYWRLVGRGPRPTVAEPVRFRKSPLHVRVRLSQVLFYTHPGDKEAGACARPAAYPPSTRQLGGGEDPSLRRLAGEHAQ